MKNVNVRLFLFKKKTSPFHCNHKCLSWSVRALSYKRQRYNHGAPRWEVPACAPLVTCSPIQSAIHTGTRHPDHQCQFQSSFQWHLFEHQWTHNVVFRLFYGCGREAAWPILFQFIAAQLFCNSSLWLRSIRTPEKPQNRQRIGDGNAQVYNQPEFYRS